MIFVALRQLRLLRMLSMLGMLRMLGRPSMLKGLSVVVGMWGTWRREREMIRDVAMVESGRVGS